MNLLPNIDFTQQELDSMLVMRHYADGGESQILWGEPFKSLYKVFTDSGHKHVIEMPENKLRKIERLYQMQLEHSVLPLSTITIDGKLIGYEMTYDFHDTIYIASRLRRKEAIHFLRQTRDILEYYAEHDITYGDIKGNNILINRRTGQAKFCDMDNVRIGEYPIDLRRGELDSYLDEIGGTVDKRVDAYMHNLFTIQSLSWQKKWPQEILKMISIKKYPRCVRKEGRPILDSMVDGKSFTGEYIIEYVRK